MCVLFSCSSCLIISLLATIHINTKKIVTINQYRWLGCQKHCVYIFSRKFHFWNVLYLSFADAALAFSRLLDVYTSAVAPGMYTFEYTYTFEYIYTHITSIHICLYTYLCILEFKLEYVYLFWSFWLYTYISVL